jgi:formate dehydrogenase iron-sulfur subunit
VLYTRVTKDLDADSIISSCPYNIPRKGPDGSLAKCDMCNDRVSNGLLPACVKACPTGTMNFGEYRTCGSMHGCAWPVSTNTRRRPVNPDKVRVIYLTAFEPTTYWEYAVAAAQV